MAMLLLDTNIPVTIDTIGIKFGIKGWYPQNIGPYRPLELNIEKEFAHNYTKYDI